MASNIHRLMEYKQFRNNLLERNYLLAYNMQPVKTWVFSDEAGTHSGTKFFGIGGLFVNLTAASGKDFGADLQSVCESNKWTDEFKWSDLSRNNIHRYTEFVKFFFSRAKTVRFHCIVVNRSLFTKGDSQSQETLFKFYYLLLSYRLQPFAKPRTQNRSMLIPDRMSLSDEHWKTLFHSVNASLKRRFETTRYPLVQCVPSESKLCLEIQMADLLLGSVVAWYNSGFQSEYKREFAENIVSKIQACDKTKASIWEWKPS
jgi:hypothetical protein